MCGLLGLKIVKIYQQNEQFTLTFQVVKTTQWMQAGYIFIAGAIAWVLQTKSY
jgi:hypothetical protein